MPQYKVMIAQFPGNDVTHPDVSDWVLRTVIKMHRDPRIGPDNVHAFRMASTPITMVRNRAVRAALNEDVDFLLMIDNDVSPDCDVGTNPCARPFWPHAFDWALENGPCNVAAPYCGAPPMEAVYVAAWVNEETDCADPEWQLKPYPRRHAAQKAGFEEVVGLATGLILIDMRIFKGHGGRPPLPTPYFDYEWKDPKTMEEMSTTEDYFFTRNCSLLRYPQYVFWDAWCGHYKKKLVGRPQVVTTDMIREQFRIACMDNFHEGERVVMIRNGKVQGV